MACPETARADVSSWMYVGGGMSRVDANDNGNFAALSFDTGLGTPATSSFVWGGVFHGTEHFGHGFDLGGALRLAMGSYVRGDYGLGLDLGSEYRFGDDNGAAGAARLLLGAPWGITGTAGGSWGADDVKIFTFTLGLDFARLTVHRETGLNWFPNPQRSPEGNPFRR